MAALPPEIQDQVFRPDREYNVEIDLSEPQGFGEDEIP